MPGISNYFKNKIVKHCKVPFGYLLIFTVVCCIIMAAGCKKKDDSSDFIENSPPAFDVFHESGNIGHIFAKCISEDIKLDTVLITDPINIKYIRYFNGQNFNINAIIDLGDTFVPTPGDWSFIFRGKKISNNKVFSSYVQKTF